MHVVEANVSICEEPVDDDGVYSFREVSRLFEVPEHRLRYWSQTGFLVPSVRRGERWFYSFRDLIAVKVAKGLLDGGQPLRRVRRQLEALRTTLPRVRTPLHDLRIRCEHDRVVVEDVSHRFEAASGQLVLDFEVSALREHAAEVLALPWVDDDEQVEGEPHTAYEWFSFAQQLEDEWGGAPADTEGLARARHAYEAALELDPRLAAAWTNLGGLLAEIGEIEEAAEHFEEALRHDPDQVQARLNLAELAMLREGPKSAVPAFREVLRRDPDCHEAHYGLARALLRQGGKGEALAHLERFSSAVDRLPHEDQDDGLLARREQARDVIGTLRAELGR
ncbi:MAG: tetratricopeptide repeat protein [Deltaproteobacteria bacterium]|nr:tetratricopeptide repeat protein [Deltaproteobacteria bacterium]